MQRAEGLIPRRRRAAIDFAGWSTSEYAEFAPPALGVCCGAAPGAMSPPGQRRGTMPHSKRSLFRPRDHRHGATGRGGDHPDPERRAGALSPREPECLPGPRRGARARSRRSSCCSPSCACSTSAASTSSAPTPNTTNATCRSRTDSSELPIRQSHLGELRDRGAHGTERERHTPGRAREAAEPRWRHSSGRVPHLRADHDPVVLFEAREPWPWDLTLRLVCPKGHPATLGVVEESTSGAVVCSPPHRAPACSPQRRSTGFPGRCRSTRPPGPAGLPCRFFVYAEPRRPRPLDTAVLFLRSDARSQAGFRDPPDQPRLAP